MNPDSVAKFDQAEGAAEHMARIIAAYYKSLLDCEIPPDFARLLTLNYQQVMLNRFK